MGNALAERFGRPPRRLLLALTLALAACGGGDEPAKSGDPAADTSAAVQTAMATDTCTGPPPAFRQAVFNGAWQALLDSLNAHAVTFPDVEGNDDTASVRLCTSANCAPVRMEIRSSNLTPCLQPDSLRGESRILGLLILVDSFPGAPGWGPIPAGDTIFTFAHQGAGPARLAYRQGDSIRSAPSTAWAFYYCRDGHTGKTAEAQWRNRRAGNAAGQGKEEVEEGEDTGKYGWMACASGCCQFYSNPPGDPGEDLVLPDPANPNAPDTVGKGRNQGQGQVQVQRPPWCPVGP